MLEDGVLAEEFLCVDNAYVEASLVKEIDAPPPRAKWARFAVDDAWRLLDRCHAPTQLGRR